MAKTPTMSDVALLAGVSVGTVSHVLRGSAHVSDALTQRVHEAAETLRYRVDPSAQALRMGYQSIFGVFLLGSRRQRENAARAFYLPFAKEVAQLGMEALLLASHNLPGGYARTADFTEILTRAQRLHLHSLVVCESARIDNNLDPELRMHDRDAREDYVPSTLSRLSTRSAPSLPVVGVYLDEDYLQMTHDKDARASLMWGPLEVGQDCSKFRCLTRGIIDQCARDLAAARSRV